MVITETFYIGEREFTKNYSDAGHYVVRDGVSYTEACDPAEFGRVYTEGDLIPQDEQEEATAKDYEAALNRLGVET